MTWIGDFMSNFTRGIVYVLLSALGFGIMPTFAVFAYRTSISVTTLLSIRFALAALILFSYCFIKSKKIKVTKKDLFNFFILGGVCYTLQSIFYFSSVKYIPGPLVVLLLYTYPMIVGFLSFIINKERLNRKSVFAIIISFIGLILIVGASFDNLSSIGILLALGAAIVYSGYILIGNRVIKKSDPMITTAFTSAFASLGIFMTGFVMGDIDFSFSVMAWYPILGLSIFCTILAIFSFFVGVDLLGPTKASILSMMEPVFAIIFSLAIFNEMLSLYQLIGGGAVLAGALLVAISNKDEEGTSTTVA